MYDYTNRVIYKARAMKELSETIEKEIEIEEMNRKSIDDFERNWGPYLKTNASI